MKTQQKTSNGWGGRRAGAGKKSLYQEPTANMTFRVPVSHKDMVRRLVMEYLDKLKKPIAKDTHIPEYGC
jgi:hypothetical protein